MKRLVGLLVIVFCVLACVMGLYISAVNRDPVVIDLLFWPSVTARSGLLAVLSFIAGSLTGLLVGMLAGIGRRRAREAGFHLPSRTEGR